MSLPKAYLATNMAEPLPTTDGAVLRTIADARNYFVEHIAGIDDFEVGHRRLSARPSRAGQIHG
jgi:hypothetical protein